MKVSSKDVRVREPAGNTAGYPGIPAAMLDHPADLSVSHRVPSGARYLSNPKYDENRLEIGRLLLTPSQKRAFQQLSDLPACARFSIP
jgi:hypothetical protein